MSEQKGYQCKICKKTKIASGDTVPICCGKPMTQVPLDICTKPHDPEHSRPMNDEDACNDFRGVS